MTFPCLIYECLWATAGQYALMFSFPFLPYSHLAGYIINLKLI